MQKSQQLTLILAAGDRRLVMQKSQQLTLILATGNKKVNNAEESTVDTYISCR